MWISGIFRLHFCCFFSFFFLVHFHYQCTFFHLGVRLVSSPTPSLKKVLKPEDAAQFSINTLIKILKWKLLTYFMRPLNSIRWIAQWLILITIHILKSCSALWSSCSLSQGLCVSVPRKVHKASSLEHGWLQRSRPQKDGIVWVKLILYWATVNLASQRVQAK